MDIVTNYPILKAFLAGSFSGTFSTVLFQPLDLLKTRLQNPTPFLKGHNGPVSMVTVFTNILQQERLFGLWRGMIPSLTRCVPGVGIYFCSLDYIKSHYFIDKQPSPFESLAMGMVARSMSGAILIPITVVKTRVESGVYGYNSVIGALRDIYRTEGVRGMTCGLLPTLFRDAPFSGLYLMFYNQIKSYVSTELLSSPYKSPVHFTCGVIAGVLASAVTQPADVLKTKMQLYPDKFNVQVDEEEDEEDEPIPVTLSEVRRSLGDVCFYAIRTETKALTTIENPFNNDRLKSFRQQKITGYFQ